MDRDRVVTRPNHHLGRRVFSAELAVPGNRAESVALSFPVSTRRSKGSLMLHGSRDFPVPGLGAYHRQIRQLLTAWTDLV